jgi:cytochrome c
MRFFLASVMAGLMTSNAGAAELGDPGRGRQAFRACAACHALDPDRNMTGPSLAAMWGRRSGSLRSFTRYSPALKSAEVVWNDDTLDHWLTDPAHYIPGNRMTFPGVKEAKTRADIIAFLKEATQPGQPQAGSSNDMDRMGGMGGGMVRAVPSLKKLDATDRVQAITYCGDTYRVATADGKTHEFWERNLRFKTDSSGEGPEKGAPAIVDAGMMGDRASVIFATPEEISSAIRASC